MRDDDSDDSDETESDLVDDDQDEKAKARRNREKRTRAPPPAPLPAPATYFVVDSFNIHRLIIAGVTCASKFFSDVFYTNSRYAKVYYNFFPISHRMANFYPMKQFLRTCPLQNTYATT